MRVFSLLSVVVLVVVVYAPHRVDTQFWKYSQQFFNPFSWIRQGKTGASDTTHVAAAATAVDNSGSTHLPTPTTGAVVTQAATTTPLPKTLQNDTTTTTTRRTVRTSTQTEDVGTVTTVNAAARTNPVAWTTVAITLPQKQTTQAVLVDVTNGGVATTSARAAAVATVTAITTPTAATVAKRQPQTTVTSLASTTVVTEEPATSTVLVDTTTQEVTGTTEEPRDNHRVHDFYLSKREKPHIKIASNISQNLLPLPAGASAALVKPTKYHYYPHNQHIYLLPECAIQQVCNAVYVRLNWTQPLCACPSRYRDPCSASLNADDLHTTELMTDRNSKRALTLVKTCEPTAEMRVCRAPRDWSLLALQNIRTGKSHYLVICRCPDTSVLEGPMSHDQPTYASVPGIRVYGMMCVQTGNNKRRGRPLRLTRAIENPPFPWHKAEEIAKTANWD